MNLSRRDFVKTIGLTLVTAPLAGCAATIVGKSKPDKPNFIVIFCDDLGYGDIGCFGSKVHRTPNIDKMAEEGIRFTSFYVTCSVCTPSRSSLMTGCYPRRVNMHVSSNNECVLFPISKKGLNPSEITIAEVLKNKGYSTACIGKWHMGDQPQFLPTRQGFDYYYGIPYSNDMGSKKVPLPLLQNENVIEAPVDQNTLTKRYTEQAVSFIDQNKDKPFFIYLPHTMPHNPVHSSEQFRGKSANNGFGDAVEEIDYSTGQILKTLKDYGLDEKTLVIFTSDNGAAQRWGGSNLPLSGWKGMTAEGGMRVPCVMRWPGKIKSGSECQQIASTIDLLPTFALLAGTKAPTDRIIDGKNIWPLMSGQSRTSPHEAFYYYQKDQLQAVRSGKWKLHLALKPKRRNWGKDIPESPLQLYDLENDIAEKNNLVDQYPEIVKKLTALANIAKADLGHENTPGTGQRPAGMVVTPVPLKL